MKASFTFIDPGAIMGVVVSLIIVAVGVFAFFTVINSGIATVPNPYAAPAATTSAANNVSYYMWISNTQNNTTSTGNTVFNIIGIVLVIGAIMSIVGLVYNYVR